MRVAFLALMTAVILRLVMMATIAAAAGYIVPAWADADETTRASLLISFLTIGWISDALFSMSDATLAVAILLSSIVMVHIGGRLWTALGWLGFVSAAAGFVASFMLALAPLEIAGFIAAIAFLIWTAASGVGLWRMQ